MNFQVQLIEGLECWIHADILSIIEVDWCNNRNMIMRSLLIHLIGEENLGEYTACGSRNTKGIPLTVRAAVIGKD